MAIPLLLISAWPAIKKILFNKATLVVLAFTIGTLGGLSVGYFKGRAAVLEKQERQALKEANETVIVQEKLEVEHDKRVRKILSAPVSDVDAARMLSTFPDEAPTTR